MLIQREYITPRYKIITKIGKGGLGEVYEVLDLWDEKRIALKLHSPESEIEKNIEDKFKQEYRLISELSHPGIVKAYDFGYTEESKAFYTMELIEGEELSSKITMPNLDIFFRIVWQICDILGYLHSQNLIHADLKPSNFKVTQDVFSLKILDFGLARKISSKTFNQTTGTPEYIAPEMWLKKDIDQRADLYSLGVILFELLTSKPPFTSEDPLILRSYHLEKIPDPPSAIRPELPESLDSLVLKLLQKNPEERFQNTFELKEEFSKIIPPAPWRIEKNTYLNLLYDSKMLSRIEEFQIIQRELKESFSSGGRMFLIEGEFGIGKSIFLNHFKMNCQLEGIFFIKIDCLEDETHSLRPIKELFSKIKPFLQTLSPELFQKYKMTFSLLLNQNQSSENPELEKLSTFILELSNLFPFVLAFEDLHWMGEESMLFFEKLSNKLENSKIFLCGTLQEKNSASQNKLKSLINRLIGTERFYMLRLPSLSEKELELFLSQKLSKEINSSVLLNFVYQNFSGIPLFALEILKHLFEKKVLFFEKGIIRLEENKLSGVEIPDSIEKTILGNLRRYPDEIQNFLNLASLIGKEFDLESIKFLCGYEEEKIFEVLFLLLKDRFLLQTKKVTSSLVYNFSSPAYQSMIYKNFPGDKKLLHRNLAYYLEQRKSEGEEIETETIALHFISSNDYSKAFDYSLQCATKNQNDLDVPRALKYLNHALDAADEFPIKKERDMRKGQTLMQRGDLLKSIGELHQAQKDYKNLLKISEFLGDKTLLAETYKDLGEIFRLKHDYQNGLNYLLKANDLYKQLNDKKETARTLNNLGNIYWVDSKYQKALEVFEEALNIHRILDNKPDLASTLNNMGAIHVSQHQYEKALEHHYKSLQIKKEIGNKEEIARSLNNIGFVYCLVGVYRKAISTSLESLKLNQEIENKKEIAINTVNLSESYFKLGEYDEAIRHAKLGLELCREIEFILPVGYLLRNQALIEVETGFYQRGLNQLSKALKCSEEIEDKELKVLNLVSLGRLFLFLNRTEIAIEYFEKAFSIAKRIDDKRSLIAIGKFKGVCLLRNEKTSEALSCLQNSIFLADELNSPEEKLSLNLEYARFGLDSNQMQMLGSHLEKAKKIIEQNYFPLYESEYYFLQSSKELQAGNLNQASALSEIAFNKASKLKQLELVWRIHYLQGKMNFTENNLEEAFKQFEKASKLIKNLSQNIEDPKLKHIYLCDEEKLILLSDIKKLTQVMVGR